MDNRMESPSWLPDAATPAVTDDTTADGSVPVLDESEPAGGAFTYSDDGSYSYQEDGRFGSQDPLPPDVTDETGYEPAGDPGAQDLPVTGYRAQVPPYQAQPPSYQNQVPSHQSQAPPYPAQAPSYQPQAPSQATAGAGMAGAGMAGAGMAGAGAAGYGTRAPVTDKAAAPRRANLVVARLEPWSVMKFSFLMSLVAWIVLFVAVAVIYYFLSHIGVFSSLQQTLQSVTSSQGSSGVKLSSYISESKVLGYTMLLGAINIVLITALATVGAVIYNLVTHIGGGIEITLKESD